MRIHAELWAKGIRNCELETATQYVSRIHPRAAISERVRSHLPTPLPWRILRAARAAAHVVAALTTIAVAFPWLDVPRKQRLIRGWSRRLLQILKIEARLHGVLAGDLPGNLLRNLLPITFRGSTFSCSTRSSRRGLLPSRNCAVGRSSGGWSSASGRYSSSATGPRHAQREPARGGRARARRRDRHLSEGTTSDGRDVLPFHGSLLQPIVDAGGHVQPVAIRYRKASGEHNDAPAYVGQTTFFESFWRVTAERVLIVELHVTPPLPARARHRRELSRAAEAAIRAALASATGAET